MDDRSTRFIIEYKRKRRHFAANVYALALFFGALAIAQWFCLSKFKEANDFFKTEWIFSVITFSTALVILMAFIFLEDLRFAKPINWVLVLLIVEGIILGIGTLIARQRQWEMINQFLIWVGICVLFIIFGSFLPHDLTLDIVVLFVMSVITFIGAMYFLMLHIMANLTYTYLVHRCFISFTVLLFIMYHAQIINGGRFAEMRTQDILLGALILFLDFIILYLFTFFSAEKWSYNCDEYKNVSSRMEFNSTKIQTNSTKTTQQLG